MKELLKITMLLYDALNSNVSNEQESDESEISFRDYDISDKLSTKEKYIKISASYCLKQTCKKSKMKSASFISSYHLFIFLLLGG